MSTIKKKLADKTAKIGIIGLGYVGIPYMVEFALSGFRVFSFDTSQTRVGEINAGISPIDDISSEQIKSLITSGLVTASSDMQLVSSCDCLIICVPTPCNKIKIPDLTPLYDVAKTLEKYAEGEQLIVLQSTSYPRTTEEIILPSLIEAEKNRNLKFYLAFSPERVDPGNKIYNVKNTPKVIGGINQEASELTKQLFGQIIGEENVITTSSPKVAEMTKMLENSFRLINISFINEFSELCQSMDIEPMEVINAASTKPFGFMPFYPSIGIGGHCIPVDPYYLSWKAREFDFVTRFIDLANEVNEKRPYDTVEQIRTYLEARANKTINNAKILAIGASFKPNIKDTRNSAALKVIKLLSKFGAEVNYHDPFISSITIEENGENIILNSETDLFNNLDEYDLVVVLTKHSEIDYRQLENRSKLYFEPFRQTNNSNKSLNLNGLISKFENLTIKQTT
jgi:UDP-N-acetyl-D-glucosamine dehydrogenase